MSGSVPISRYGGSRAWNALSAQLRSEAGSCACVDHCGTHRGVRCAAPPSGRIVRHRDEPSRWLTADEAARRWRDPAWSGPSIRAVISVAHLNHMPDDHRRENLLPVCPRCHLLIDGEQHRRTTRRNRYRRSA